MVQASLTKRGSTVITPSTSVHIQTSFAFNALPMIAAEKSLPPRPSVVVTPSGVAEMKPVIIGIIP